MQHNKFINGDRVVVWISQRDDVQEGDAGTVIEVRQGASDAWYLDVILDTGIRLGNYHHFTFRAEADYDSDIPF
jgi:hypothetical protein